MSIAACGPAGAAADADVARPEIAAAAVGKGVEVGLARRVAVADVAGLVARWWWRAAPLLLLLLRECRRSSWLYLVGLAGDACALGRQREHLALGDGAADPVAVEGVEGVSAGLVRVVIRVEAGALPGRLDEGHEVFVMASSRVLYSRREEAGCRILRATRASGRRV